MIFLEYVYTELCGRQKKFWWTEISPALLYSTGVYLIFYFLRRNWACWKNGNSVKRTSKHRCGTNLEFRIQNFKKKKDVRKTYNLVLVCAPKMSPNFPQMSTKFTAKNNFKTFLKFHHKHTFYFPNF